MSIVNLLNRISIKFKILGSMGMMLLILLAIALSSHQSLTKVDKQVTEVVKDIQPTVIASMSLSENIKQTSSALGFYLLSKTEQDKNAYLDGIGRVDDNLKNLKSIAWVQQDPKTSDQVNRIAKDVSQFIAYKEQLLELAANDAKNIPAMLYSAQNINPLSQQMLQHMGVMIASEEEEEANEERRAILMDIERMRYTWSNVMNGTRAYLAFRGKASLDEVALYNTETGELINKIKAHGEELTFEQSDAIEAIASLRDQFNANFKKMKVVHGGPKWRIDSYMIRTEISPLVNTIAAGLKKLVEEQQALAELNSNALIEQVGSSKALQLTLLAIGLLVGVLIIAGISLFVIKPIASMRDLLKDISEGEGDLTQRCKVDSSDELGQASSYFNNVMESLQNMFREVVGVAGDLRERTTDANNEIVRVSENVARSADSARTTATATEELSATASEIARHASEAAQEAAEVQQISEEGGKCVGDMSTRAHEMENEIKRLKGDVDELTEKSKGMLSMVGAINDIANQTNLLALNAAIEAARAGEMGRGFAVVADEVRQLAMKTQDSTSQITTLITDNMQSNENLSQMMGRVADVTHSMMESVSSTSESITRMSSGVVSMSDRVGQIATASGEQSMVTNEVAGNIEQIAHAEDDNAGRSEQVAQNLNLLQDLSSRLDTMMQRFKI